jgi:uncharacterized membrane protein YfcA
MVLLIFVVGIICGFLNTIAGGGSLISLPVLIFLGLPPTVANGTNRLSIVMQNIVAVSTFRSQGVWDFGLSMRVTIPAAIGALIGAHVAIDMDGESFKRLLAVVMLIVMFITFFGRYNIYKHEIKALSTTRKWLLSSVFFLIGIYGGLVQAGVGFYILAALSQILHIDLVKANAIKVFVILAFTLVALVSFALAAKVVWLTGFILGLGNALGGWLGAHFAVLKGARWIRWILMVVVLIFSIKLFFF